MSYNCSSYFKRKRFWLNDLFHGAPMWNHFKDIHFIRVNIEKGEYLRKKYLIDFLKFAHENNPFYKTLPYSENLQEYPVVNKKIIVDNYNDFLTPYNLIPGQKGDLHIQKTSGSSGTPFALPQDTNCRLRRIATIKEENELIGFHSYEPMVHFRSLRHYYSGLKDIVWNKDLNIIYIDNAELTDFRLKNIVQVINKHKVKVIRGYMTTLDTLSRYIYENNLELISKPTFISGGELLLESLRERVVRDLHCNIISQYANEENGVFGQSKINGDGRNIILNRANCYIEILKLNSNQPAAQGELGRVVVTDFTNYAMPMIRYDIGDMATYGEFHKNILLSLHNLSGRKTDIIYKTSGEPIDFFNSISTEIYNNPDIRQWQFVQQEDKKYLLKLVLIDQSLRLKEEHFKNLIKDVLGDDADVSVSFLDSIPTLSSGKFKIIINEL